jgi:hypothetical protein
MRISVVAFSLIIFILCFFPGCVSPALFVGLLIYQNVELFPVARMKRVSFALFAVCLEKGGNSTRVGQIWPDCFPLFAE